VDSGANDGGYVIDDDVIDILLILPDIFFVLLVEEM